MSSVGAGGAVWSLEVVRGAEPGRRYALEGSSVELGGGEVRGGEAGLRRIGLRAAAGVATRPLAARHAVLEQRHGTWVIRDLESETGTVVNRQRLVPGSARALAAGDVIDLGAVRLQVVKGSQAAGSKPADAGGGGQAGGGVWSRGVVILPGVSCRSWSEVLVLTTQKWGQVRDALVRGDLERVLVEAGLGPWAPGPGRSAGQTGDERLDEWLGRLPLGREIRAELELQPTRLILGARGSGGGVLERTVQVLNVGERLLRWRAEVEPAGVKWLEVVNGDGEHLTSEGDVLVLRVRLPEGLRQTERAGVVVRSNGGEQRVEVVLEAGGAGGVSVRAAGAVGAGSGPSAGETVAWPRSGLEGGVVLGVVLGVARLLIGMCDRVLGPMSGAARPGLLSGLVVGGMAGLLLGMVGALRWRARGWDVAWSVLGGLLGGMYGATLLVAVGRVLESAVVGGLGGGGWLTALVWGVVGGGVGWAWGQSRGRRSVGGGGG